MALAFTFQLLLTSLVFICYLFKIKFSNFNWYISRYSLVSVFMIFLAGRPLFFLISNGKTNIAQIFSSVFYLKVIFFIFYPVFFEEILYRGFLISGLKSFGLSDWKCNIIQSILFGVIHMFSFGAPTFNTLLSTAAQAMTGYVLGKLYFKTKSLTPNILLHALWNAYTL